MTQKMKMLTDRRVRLEKILNAIEDFVANGNGPTLRALEGGDPLDELIAEVKSSWKVMDVLAKDMFAPGDEDTENELICVFESYLEEGNKKDG